MVTVVFRDGKKIELEETDGVMLPRSFMDDFYSAIRKGKGKAEARGIEKVKLRNGEAPGANFFLIEFEGRRLLFEILPGEASRLVGKDEKFKKLTELNRILLEERVRIII